MDERYDVYQELSEAGYDVGEESEEAGCDVDEGVEEAGYDVDKELAEAFEAKHNVFLTELGCMPVGGSRGEERKERLKFFREYPMRNDFQVDAMQAYRPVAYRRLVARMAKWEQSFGGERDADTASAKNKHDLDTMVFVEAINKAVESYTGKTKDGGSYTFLAGVGKLYRQLAAKETAKNDLGEMGISDTEIPERNLYRIMRLVRAKKEMMARMGKKESPEKIMDTVQAALKKEYTKKEWQLIRTLVFNTVFSVSIDTDAEDDDGPTFQLADKKNGIREAEDRQAARDTLKVFCENIERKWALVDFGKGLREKRIIQLFFSANVLKELKLDEEEEPYDTEPAGDEEFYLILKPQGRFLYQKLLDEKYMERAFREYPGDFYEVYVKLLRPDFEFSDKIIAELEGKDKSTVSRDRKKYVELLKTLCDFTI